MDVYFNGVILQVSGQRWPTIDGDETQLQYLKNHLITMKNKNR